MTVSRQEVDQMANFMKALSASNTSTVPLDANVGSDAISRLPTTTDGMIPTAPRPIDSSVREMRTILERFHNSAGSAVTKVNAEARYDRDLREALVTEKTAKGSRIGQWNIEMRESGKRKFYNVVGADGVTMIAEDLLLYEAALGLVRILNGGGKLNSQDAVSLLRAEQDYASALNDAVIYKHYLTKQPNGGRAQIFEARYSVAKDKAVAAREQVFSISKRC